MTSVSLPAAIIAGLQGTLLGIMNMTQNDGTQKVTSDAVAEEVEQNDQQIEAQETCPGTISASAAICRVIKAGCQNLLIFC